MAPIETFLRRCYRKRECVPGSASSPFFGPWPARRRWFRGMRPAPLRATPGALPGRPQTHPPIAPVGLPVLPLPALRALDSQTPQPRARRRPLPPMGPPRRRMLHCFRWGQLVPKAPSALRVFVPTASVATRAATPRVSPAPGPRTPAPAPRRPREKIRTKPAPRIRPRPASVTAPAMAPAPAAAIRWAPSAPRAGVQTPPNRPRVPARRKERVKRARAEVAPPTCARATPAPPPAPTMQPA